MPWILSKIMLSKALAKDVLFLRKSKAEFVLTNLKTFDTFVFYNYEKIKCCNHEQTNMPKVFNLKKKN